MLVNQLQCMTPSKRFGFLLLWYASYHGTAIKYALAMVPHTAACGDTFMNAVSKAVDTAPSGTTATLQALTRHHFSLAQPAPPHLHLLHLQHQQPRWTRLQLFLPHQLFKGMPKCQCLWHPMPHLCHHEDPAMPTWHQNAWSRKSKNYQPWQSMDLVS